MPFPIFEDILDIVRTGFWNSGLVRATEEDAWPGMEQIER